MFQRFGRLLGQQSQSIGRRYGQVAEQAKSFVRPKEINRVVLVGSVISEYQRLGDRQLLGLKTFNKDSTYCVHDVVVKNPELSLHLTKLDVGRRICVVGRVSTPFVNGQHSKTPKMEIIANYICETDSMVDENCVECMGDIISTVNNDFNQSSFFLSNNFVTKDRMSSGETSGFEANYVRVAGSQMAIEVARTLTKRDRVYLNGSVMYAVGTDAQGNQYGKGEIECNHIVRLGRYNKQPTDEFGSEANESAAETDDKLW